MQLKNLIAKTYTGVHQQRPLTMHNKHIRENLLPIFKLYEETAESTCCIAINEKVNGASKNTAEPHQLLGGHDVAVLRTVICCHCFSPLLPHSPVVHLNQPCVKTF